MSVVIAKIVPVIIVFFLGYVLKQIRILTKEDGSTLLKIFFYISIPSLILLSVSQMKFTGELLWLPVVAALVILANYLVAHCCGRYLKLDSPSLGAFLVGSIIMNTGVMFPFLLAVKGEEGLAQGALFDLGNTALIFTFVYWIACRHGASTDNKAAMVMKLLTSPPLIAVAIGLFLNLNHLALLDGPARLLGSLGYMSMPLIMLTLGIYFSPVPYRVLPVFSAVFIRIAIGLLLGFLFVAVFDLKGLSKAVVLVCSSAPSGVTTLVFCSMEKLDNEFAASVVSYSLVISLFLVPLLLKVYAG